MKTYLQILIGVIGWGLILWFFGNQWYQDQREVVCVREVEKKVPDLKLVKTECLAAAEIQMEKNAYGSASWFYLLGGEVDKNIEEINPKINDDFYMNIGHSYVLTGEYEKVEKIYKEFLWDSGLDYIRSNGVAVEEDYEILPRLYADKKENLKKGLEIWRKIYLPVEEMIIPYEKYTEEREKYDENLTLTIKYLENYLKKSEIFKERTEINYWSHLDELAKLYYDDDRYQEAITAYAKSGENYQKNHKYKEYAETLFWRAKSANYDENQIEAIRYYKMALPNYIEEEGASSSSVAYIYNNIGDIYNSMAYEESNLDLYTKAIDYYGKAINHKEEYHPYEYSSLYLSYENRSDSYESLDQYKEASSDYIKSLALIKLELKSSTEAIDDDLDELTQGYKQLFHLYKEMKLNKQTEELNQSVELFKEYEVYLKKNYKDKPLVIAKALYALADYYEVNSTLSVELDLTAISFIKLAIESSDESEIDENTNLLISYFNRLNDLYKDAGMHEKEYFEHLNSLREFQEKIFLDKAEPNQKIMARTYSFLAQNYDLNRSKSYGIKSIYHIKKAIENEKEKDKKSEYGEIIDLYYVQLFSIIYESYEDKNITTVPSEILPLIDEYLEFQQKNFKDNVTVKIASYENLASFFLFRVSNNLSYDYSRKALDIAYEHKDIGLVERNLYALFSYYDYEKNVSLEKIEYLVTEIEQKLPEEKMLISWCYGKLGEFATYRNNSSVIEQSYKKAISLAKEHLSEVELNKNLLSLHDLEDYVLQLLDYYQGKGDKKNSIKVLTELSTFLKEKFPNAKTEQARVNKMFFDSYLYFEDKKKAIIAINHAIETTKTLFINNNNAYKYFMRYVWAKEDFYKKEGNIKGIRKEIKVLEELVLKVKDREGKAKVKSLLSELYLLIEDYQLSIDSMQKANTFNDVKYVLNCKELGNDYGMIDIYLEEKNILKLEAICKKKK